MSSRLGKSGVFTLLGVLLLASSAFATNCEKRVRNAEMNLQRAVAKHGPHSRQAENKRRHLEEVRATCHWR